MVWMVTAKCMFDEMSFTSKQNILIGSQSIASFQSELPSSSQPLRRQSERRTMPKPVWSRIVL